MIPKENDLLDFIKKRDIVNFSAIAKYFGIQNITVSDLIKDLEKKRLVTIQKLGGSKIVRIKK